LSSKAPISAIYSLSVFFCYKKVPFVRWGHVAAGLLPRSVGDGIAASLIGGTRWQAGATLMDEASPDSFDKMVRLYEACGEQTTALCEAAVAVRSIQDAVVKIGRFLMKVSSLNDGHK
jgi:hypothetical protein